MFRCAPASHDILNKIDERSMATLLVTFQLGLMLHAMANPASPSAAPLVIGAILALVHFSFIVWFLVHFVPEAVRFLKLRAEVVQSRAKAIRTRLVTADPFGTDADASGASTDAVLALARAESATWRIFGCLRRTRRRHRDDNDETAMVVLSQLPRDVVPVVPEVLRES